MAFRVLHFLDFLCFAFSLVCVYFLCLFLAFRVFHFLDLLSLFFGSLDVGTVWTCFVFSVFWRVTFAFCFRFVPIWGAMSFFRVLFLLFSVSLFDLFFNSCCQLESQTQASGMNVLILLRYRRAHPLQHA